MDLLVFAVVVLLAAVLLIMLIEAVDKEGKLQPFARIIILLVALVVIAQRAGAF